MKIKKLIYRHIFGLLLATSLLLIFDRPGSAQVSPTINRVGHTAEIKAIALSPDGKLLASSGLDNTLRIWDIVSGYELFMLRGKTETNPQGIDVAEDFFSLVFSPDGKTLAAGSNYGISFFDPKTGKILSSFANAEYASAVTALSFSADGKLLGASCDSPEITGGKAPTMTAAVWNVADHSKVTSFNGAISPIAFNPAGTTLATSGKDEWIQIWNIRSGKKMMSLKTPKEYARVQALSFDKSGATLAAMTNVTKQGEVMSDLLLMDSSTGKPVKTTQPLKSYHLGLYAADGINVIRDQFMGEHIFEFVNPLSGKVVSFVDADTDVGEVSNVYAFSSNGKVAAFQGLDGHTVHLFDLISRKESRISIGYSIHVTSAAFSPDSRQIAAGYSDNLLWWDIQSGKVVKTVIPTSEGKPEIVIGDRMEVSNDSKRFMFDSAQLNVFDSLSGQKLLPSAQKLPWENDDAVADYSFAADGKVFTCVSKETVTIRENATGKIVRRFLLPFTGEEADGLRIASSYDNEVLALATEKQVSFWDSTTEKEIKELPEKEDAGDTFRFSPDGRFFVIGARSDGGKISVLRYSTQEEVLSVDDSYPYFAISPDSKTIASINKENHLVLTSLINTDADPLVSDEDIQIEDYLYSEGNFGLVFSPDGKKVAVYGMYGLSVFDTGNGKLIQTMK